LNTGINVSTNKTLWHFSKESQGLKCTIVHLLKRGKGNDLGAKPAISIKFTAKLYTLKSSFANMHVPDGYQVRKDIMSMIITIYHTAISKVL